jgi:hypothetical protein
LVKKPGTRLYEGEHGKVSLAMELTFYLVIFETLLRFSPKVKPRRFRGVADASSLRTIVHVSVLLKSP